MAGYVIANVTVKDAERYERYKAMVVPTLDAYGGQGSGGRRRSTPKPRHCAWLRLKRSS